MELFDSHRKKFLRRFSLLLPLCFLILISSIFFISVSFASDETLHKEQQALEQALENGAIRSYAMNGQYPESLDQILNDYHITYDRPGQKANFSLTSTKTSSPNCRLILEKRLMKKTNPIIKIKE